MRETLHQLTMALALPLAVTAVWVVRGNPGPVEATETATAYRAELAALPLPRSERLRAPREAIDWRRAQRETEEPIAPRLRVTLPEPAPARPVALTPSDDSARDRGVLAAPRVAAPELPPVSDPSPRAARAAQPTVATLPAVVPSAASSLARVAASEADASEATAESQPEPAAKTAKLAPATPASGSKPVARAFDEGVRASQAPTVAKLDVAANVPTRDPVKLASTASATPAHTAPAVVAASAARTNASAPKSPPPITPARSASPTRRYEAPAKAPQVRGELETIEKQWREKVAASAPSPAVAQATRGLDEALDLLLGGGGRRDRSLLDAVLPTAHASAAPPELTRANPAPVAAVPSAPESLPGLLDLPLQALAALAARFYDGAAEADRADFASERRYPPLQTLFMIPEPASATLIGVGLAALAATRRRKRRG